MLCSLCLLFSITGKVWLSYLGETAFILLLFDFTWKTHWKAMQKIFCIMILRVASILFSPSIKLTFYIRGSQVVDWHATWKVMSQEINAVIKSNLIAFHQKEAKTLSWNSFRRGLIFTNPGLISTDWSKDMKFWNNFDVTRYMMAVFSKINVT